eukprot:1014605-Rhodomonas_salina.2
MLLRSRVTLHEFRTTTAHPNFEALSIESVFSRNTVFDMPSPTMHASLLASSVFPVHCPFEFCPARIATSFTTMTFLSTTGAACPWIRMPSLEQARMHCSILGVAVPFTRIPDRFSHTIPHCRT